MSAKSSVVNGAESLFPFLPSGRAGGSVYEEASSARGRRKRVSRVERASIGVSPSALLGWTRKLPARVRAAVWRWRADRMRAKDRRPGGVCGAHGLKSLGRLHARAARCAFPASRLCSRACASCITSPSPTARCTVGPSSHSGRATCSRFRPLAHQLNAPLCLHYLPALQTIASCESFFLSGRNLPMPG